MDVALLGGSFNPPHLGHLLAAHVVRALEPVDQVWFSPSGSLLFARTRSGKVFQTADFEAWLPAPNAPDPPRPVAAPASFSHSGE